jgi:hypothetical protein
MTTWTVAGQVMGETGPGVWIRVKRVLLPNGEEMPLPEEPVYFLRWEVVTTARLHDALPADIRRDEFRTLRAALLRRIVPAAIAGDIPHGAFAVVDAHGRDIADPTAAAATYRVDSGLQER